MLSHAPKERQTVLFSATLPGPIKSLIKTFTNNPVNVHIQDQALTIPSIEQVYYEVDRRSKLEVLCRLIDIEDIKYGIIFCATKMMVDELAEHLIARGYLADKLHGDISQQARERVMAKFRKRAFEFLVATDVAARGLDVDDIEVVFNYDLPHDGEDYVHRIGRTGRAGRKGRAITFVAGREIYKIQNIMRFTKGQIRRAKVPSADEVRKSARTFSSNHCARLWKKATTSATTNSSTACSTKGIPPRTSRARSSICSPPRRRGVARRSSRTGRSVRSAIGITHFKNTNRATATTGMSAATITRAVATAMNVRRAATADASARCPARWIWSRTSRA